MMSLQTELSTLTGAKIILWLNHPELKSMNGTLTKVEADHIEVVVDQRAYLITCTSIVAIRAA